MDHFGLVPIALERALSRPKPLYVQRLQPAAAAPLSEVEEWLVDTGCGYDLVCKADVEKIKSHNVRDRRWRSSSV